MSKVKIQGNASGTAEFTIEAPNGSTNRTLTLPDKTGTLLDSSGQMYDQWKLTTTVCGPTADVLITNWERVLNYGGTGMTHSSGTFSFPSTGIYKVVAATTVYGTAADNQGGFRQWYTTDNSTYNVNALGYTGGNSDGNGGSDIWSGTGYISSYLDITDISLCKLQYKTFSLNNAGNCLQGTTSNIQTSVTFERLGDT